MWFLQVAQGIPQGRRQRPWATRPLGPSCSVCPLEHNSTCCFVGKSGLLWSRRDFTSLAEVSPQSGHVRAEGSSKALQSAPARPLQAFLLQPSAPALLMVPQGFTSPDNLMASLSTPLLAVSLSLFNTSLRVVWISHSQA